MALDLSVSNVSAWSEAGYEFEVVIPGTYEGTGAFIKVRGVESKIAKTYLRKKFLEYQREELAKARSKNKQKDDVKTIEQLEEENTELAITRIISWRGFMEDGKELPFTQENAYRVLAEHSWLRDLVLENSAEVSNFRPE